VTGIEAANAILLRKGLTAKQRALVCAQPPASARLLGAPFRAWAALRRGLRGVLGLD
jgi:hypothetical protein